MTLNRFFVDDFQCDAEAGVVLLSSDVGDRANGTSLLRSTAREVRMQLYKNRSPDRKGEHRTQGESEQ